MILKGSDQPRPSKEREERSRMRQGQQDNPDVLAEKPLQQSQSSNARETSPLASIESSKNQTETANGWSENSSKPSKIRVVDGGDNMEAKNDSFGGKEIPTLDEDEAGKVSQTDDMVDGALNLAAPPNVKINRYKTILEIDNELKTFSSMHRNEQNSLLTNVNLGPLLGHLFAEQDTRNEDVEWTWNKSFTTVSAKVNELLPKQ